MLDAYNRFDDNQGPLVRINRLDDNGVNGIEVRAEEVTAETIWDDTDMVHVVRDEIIVNNHHTYSGIRLQSSAEESLVVKLQGANAGLTANGVPLEIDDRIGGAVQILGTVGHPVVLTSLDDCTIGAGFTPDGLPQIDTLETGVCSLQPVGIINAPMIDQFADATSDVDEWYLIADSTGQVSVEVYDDDGGIIDIDGLVTTNVGPQSTTTITLGGLTPGSEHVFTHTFTTFTHYRPQFQGVSAVYLREDASSPNDVFNSSSGNGFSEGSNLELGFDVRFNTLPSSFADTTWFYDLDVGDTITWRGFFDDFPLGADAASIDLVDPNGVIQSSATSQPILPIPGTTLSATVASGQEGFWGIRITAPNVIAPFAGHYLMDVEVTDQAGDRDAIKSERHYLLPQSFADTSLSSPGDWRSIKLDLYSNDRNIGVINEQESASTETIDINSTTDNAQFLGNLAPDDKSGDENRRLGFEIHGHISVDDPTDIDVYSFRADAGSEVWFDVDRTSQSLDAILELISANEAVLARSVDHATLSGLAFPVDENPLLVGDFYTLNHRDPGMRVILPGITGEEGTYFIRLRSNPQPINPIGTPKGGLTSGEYQLQLRLRQVDEFPGSSIHLADIRFATDGVEVLGHPAHSQLVSESGESIDAANDNPASPQSVGNVLTTDRASLGIAGNLISDLDVDWLNVAVDHDRIQSIGGVNDAGKTIGTVFDIDYGDGVARGDTTVAVYDDSGQLVLIGRDSNIEDDIPIPGTVGLDDLRRGSFGDADPFIGPVHLPEGDGVSYNVAVLSNAQIPAIIDGTFLATSTNPLVRLEPTNGVVRIAEDHIGFQGIHVQRLWRNSQSGRASAITDRHWHRR